MTQRHHVTRHMTCPYSIGPMHIPACYPVPVSYGYGWVTGYGVQRVVRYPWVTLLVRTSLNFQQHQQHQELAWCPTEMGIPQPQPTPRVRSQTRESLSASLESVVSLPSPHPARACDRV